MTERITPYLQPRAKLRLERPVFWDHHRGGWRDAVEMIRKHLNTPDGTRLLTAVEETMNSGEVINEPWVGFIHETPHHDRFFPDLDRLVQMDTWRASIGRCRGLWALSRYQRNYLQSTGIEVPIGVLPYPVTTPPTVHRFSFKAFADSRPRPLVYIGGYLRRFEPFWQLSAPGYDKILLRCPDVDPNSLPDTMNSDVRIIDHVPDDDYDRTLSQSMVFLSLADAGANTIIVECLARTTPVLLNQVGGVTEYLGEGYPLYYETIDEAQHKLQDLDLIASAVLYLRRRNSPASLHDFITAIQNSAIYRNLPMPRSTQTRFRAVDLTVLICSYQRVDGLSDLLTRFTRQDCPEDFELIVWNNNGDATSAVQSICDEFKDRLRVKVIHSDENFYCIVRLAVVSLMRSDLLLICDDDVLPEPSYITTFLRAHRTYGQQAAICVRGNVFLPHDLDEEHPESTWATAEHLEFYDEADDDRQVHYMHADNCLIPRHVLRKALQVELPSYEFTLVDDYWLSYVISHLLRTPIWKIKADAALSFTQSANDPRVALCMRNEVREQVVNFYIYHMRAGWPGNCQ